MIRSYARRGLRLWGAYEAQFGSVFPALSRLVEPVTVSVSQSTCHNIRYLHTPGWSAHRGLFTTSRLNTARVSPLFSGSRGSVKTYATYRYFEGARPFVSTDHRTLFKGVAVVGTIGGVFYVTHLEETPVSGRRRFMIVSEGLEERLGGYQYLQLLRQYRHSILPDNHPAVIRVRNVMKRLIQVSGLPDVNWEIHVVNDPREPPNAFVLPGGKVFVFSSILPICQDDDGLATVLSHETAHQIARHIGEKLSQMPFYLFGSLLLQLLLGSSMDFSSLVALLLEMPASRQMESEADYIGLLMMSKACFDPRKAVAFWGRMQRVESVQPMEFLSTHPSSSTRIQQITEWLPKAIQTRETSDCYTMTNNFMDAFGFMR
ncbi:peptidase family M48-domain-containing protein [Lipomyces mesembrius]